MADNNIPDSDKGVMIVDTDGRLTTLVFKNEEAINHLWERLKGTGVFLASSIDTGMGCWEIDIRGKYPTNSPEANLAIEAACGSYEELLQQNNEQRPTLNRVYQAAISVAEGKGRILG